MKIIIFIYACTLGIAITISNDQTISDYSYFTARDMIVNPLMIARCVTGLSPCNSDNSEVGGWFFNGNAVPSGRKCNDSNVIESNGAPISDNVGVIDLFQCGTLSISSEGIYTCETNNAMMDQSIRLGLYLTTRSKLHDMYSVSLLSTVYI